jgi:probable phosphoglycerate mutase
MELLLIRHALPVRRELEEGRADPELSDIGVQQAQRLADYLSTERIHTVYSSPLLRARQTAEPLAAVHSLEIQTEDGLAEYDRDSSEYIPLEELKAANDPRWAAMLAGEWAGDVPREAWEQRVIDTVERLVAQHPGHRIALVCHGGVLSTYLGHVLNVPDRQGFFYPNYTSVHRVAAARSGERTILAINETAHLRGTDLLVRLFAG